MGDATALLQQLADEIARMGAPEALADKFCDLDDDGQAKFFVAVAAIMATWPRNNMGFHAAKWQAVSIGRHLATCECATDGARDFIRDVAEGMEPST